MLALVVRQQNTNLSTSKRSLSHERITINKKSSSRSQLCLNTNLLTIPVARGGWRGMKAFTVTIPRNASVLAVTKICFTEIPPPTKKSGSRPQPLPQPRTPHLSPGEGARACTIKVRMSTAVPIFLSHAYSFLNPVNVSLHTQHVSYTRTP